MSNLLSLEYICHIGPDFLYYKLGNLNQTRVKKSTWFYKIARKIVEIELRRRAFLPKSQFIGLIVNKGKTPKIMNFDP
jgi:hypothetical protein